MATKSDLVLPPSLQALLPIHPSLNTTSMLSHVHDSLSTPIFNHSLRVYFLAVHLTRQKLQSNTRFTSPSGKPVSHDIPLHHLFAASIFHDMGLCASHNGPHRFEVEGADAAVRYLIAHGFEDDAALDGIWGAIALHSSAGLGERIGPYTWVIRTAVKADFAPEVRDGLGLTEVAAELERSLPRLGIENCLARAIVGQATDDDMKQGLYVEGSGGRWVDRVKFPIASQSGTLLRAHLEKVRDEGQDWEGENPAF